MTEAPALSALSLKDAGGNAITLDTTISSSSTASEVSGLVTTDTVKLTANFKTENGVKLYLGKNTEPYTARLQDVEVNLADYRDAKGVANIPLKLVYEGEGGQKLENTYTVHLTRSLAAENAPTITKQPITEASVAKDTKVALSIEAKAPKDGLTLSYQWLSTWSEFDAASGEGTAIEGATSATYEAPAQAETGEQYFFCRVTATDASGAIATAYSDACLVTTELTYVNTPVITIQPGLTADKRGLGVYRTEYPAGTAFDEMWFAVDGKSENRPTESGSHNYVYVTETGCAPYEVKFYYNTTPSVEGAKEIPGTIEGSIEGSGGRYMGFLPEIGLPQGENYVFFTVTSTSEADPTKSASTVSNFVKLTYTEPDYGFEGDGTESNPYLLKSGDDFVTIQKQTNEANITFANVYFKMANDITLPADWVSIGANGSKGSYFSGVLDGGGYQLNYADQSQPLLQVCQPDHHQEPEDLRQGDPGRRPDQRLLDRLSCLREHQQCHAGLRQLHEGCWPDVRHGQLGEPGLH